MEVVELRVGVVIGSGSASFEMLRYLVEVLPIMVTPRWVTTQCQPISISDVVAVLAQAVTDAEVRGGIYEIGGPDVVTYAEMMAIYAEIAGLSHRHLIRVPVLSPGLSAHRVGLVTPVPAENSAWPRREPHQRGRRHRYEVRRHLFCPSRRARRVHPEQPGGNPPGAETWFVHTDLTY